MVLESKQKNRKIIDELLKESESHKVIRKIEAFKDKEVLERILKEEEDR